MTHLKSMTAFGLGALSCGGNARLICELQSLNRRHLDCQITLPTTLLSTEIAIRRLLAKRLGRGQIACHIKIESDDAPCTATPNLARAAAIADGWKVLSEKLGLAEQMPTDYLLAFREELFAPGEEIISEEQVLKVVDLAIDALIAMRLKEGELLGEEMASLLSQLQERASSIEAHTPAVVEKYREKLVDRLTALHEVTEGDERILKEVALFAEKVDISEEIVRLKSHLTQLGQWLSAPLDEEKQTKGKMGEFLVQELVRETNTIGSKANHLPISQETLQMKHVLEKLREQMQNIE